MHSTLTEEKDRSDIRLPQYLIKYTVACNLPFQPPLPGNSVNIIWK